MSRTLLALALLLLAGAPAALTAQSTAPPAAPARPEAFEALMRCRAIADAAARLQCFDSAAANLDAAAARRDVVIVDRAQVREGRRRLFGLTLPRIPIFGGGDDDDHDADQVRTVEGVIASAAEGGNRWTIALQDGAIWVQQDYNQLAFRPRPGQHVVINRGAMGSFMMRINNQPGIRVQRVR
jgi:hypothetical protein